MRRRLEQFMQGRYGTDELTKFLMAICLILLLANTFTRQPLLYWLALVLIGYCYFRMFSRNISGRNEENQKYLSWTACGQKIRIPRGKGKICITCPKCRHEFEKRS